MKETLITFETAKLAKEKGFDNIYSSQYIQYDYDDWRLKTNQEYNYLDREIGIGNKIRISAPTQPLLQKWLREVHKIDLFLDSVGSGLYFYRIYQNDKEDNQYEQEKETSYEEALEKELQEALKLI